LRYYLLPPIHSLSSPGLQGLPVGVFVIEGVVVSSLIAALRSARQRAEASILEAHRHQQNLRRSEERFRLLVEGIIDYAIFMLDPMGRVATWNESAERIQGYKAEEILGEHFSRFYTQEDVSRGHPEEQLRVATTAGRYEGEGWQVSKKGSHFWASILITALKDEAGNLRGFARVSRDITERKRAEEAVSQSEALYRTVVEQAAENIFLVDAETKRIVRANAAMQRSLGCTSEEIRAMTLYDVVAHDHESIARKIRLIRQEGSFLGERKYRRKDGSLVDVDVSASLISLGGRETFYNLRDIDCKGALAHGNP
jgi:PAS domain S-box-containing protein